MIKYGKGCIRTKGNGTYQLIVTLGKIKGKPKRYYKTVHCDSLEEARDMLAVFHSECEKGQVSSSSIDTFGEYCKKNLENKYATGKIKKSTYVGNVSKMNNNFKTIWNKKIKDITVEDIQNIVDEMSLQLSPKTVKNIFSIIKTTLRKAVSDGIIITNPSGVIELPSWHRKEAEYYDSEETKILVSQLDKTKPEDINFRAAIMVALFGGLRKGELCGLNESDVNFLRGTITIRRNRIRCDRDGVYEDTTKTERSSRTISMPKTVMNILAEVIEYNDRQSRIHKEVWQNSPALFKDEVGKSISPQRVYRWLIQIEEEAGLKHLCLHGLRHTHVAMLAANPENTIEKISHRLGHSSTATTMKIYMHLFDKRDDDIASQLEETYF